MVPNDDEVKHPHLRFELHPLPIPTSLSFPIPPPPPPDPSPFPPHFSLLFLLSIPLYPNSSTYPFCSKISEHIHNIPHHPHLHHREKKGGGGGGKKRNKGGRNVEQAPIPAATPIKEMGALSI